MNMKLQQGRTADDISLSDANSRHFYDIHLREGRELMKRKEYNKALISFNKALELKPGDEATLVARSRCYLEMGRRLRALRDVEVILDTDVTNTEALHAKAETLYQSGNYELALVYFHRGLKQQADNKMFQAGIQKSQEAVLKFGGQSRGLRESAVTDFHLYTRRKHWATDQRTDGRNSVTDVSAPLSDRTHDRSPVNFRSGLYCPLARITKKPGITHFRSVTNGSDSCSRGSDAPGVKQTTLDEESLRQILGELYTDRKYLQNLHTSLDWKDSVTDLADSGISYLQERGAYWDRLGPLPPPQPARRKYPRSSGSTLTRSTSLCSLQTNESTLSSFKPKKSPRDVISVPSDINFRFETYQHDGEGMSVDMETDSYIGRSDSLYLTSEPTMTTFDGNEMDQKRRRELSLYIATELDAVTKLYNEGRFPECQARANNCLTGVESLDEGEITDKLGTLATLHSYLGNAAAAEGQFSEAEYHHTRDLEIGDNDDMPDVTSRALGNLGRMYMRARKYNKALDVLSMKAPLCANPKEVAWVFLEIGLCYLSLGHFDYAKDCGKKVLKVSRDLGSELQRLQAELLVAIAQEKMKHYEKAVSSYGVALETAKTRGDRMAEYVVQRAIDMVSRMLAFSRKRINKRGTTTSTPRDSDQFENSSLNGDTIQIKKEVDGRTNDQSEGADNTRKGVPRNLNDREYEGENVISLLLTLREDSNSYAKYPEPKYQRVVDETAELTTALVSTKDPGEINKRQPSVTKRSSFRRKKSNVQFDKRISFKLWDKDAQLFEDSQDDSESTARSKSNRDKVLSAIKQKSMRIRYQNMHRPLPVINKTRYCQDFVDGSVPKIIEGNIVAAAIAESGFLEFVKFEHNIFSNCGENSEVIKTSEIPPFIQKNNLLFELSKKNDKIVFTPVESFDQARNKWKILYMRIRQGQRQFTVPVADEQPEDVVEKLRDSKKNKAATVKQDTQVKQSKKSYPIRLGTKRQFKSKMASNLGPVPEGRE